MQKGVKTKTGKRGMYACWDNRDRMSPKHTVCVRARGKCDGQASFAQHNNESTINISTARFSRHCAVHLGISPQKVGLLFFHDYPSLPLFCFLFSLSSLTALQACSFEVFGKLQTEGLPCLFSPKHFPSRVPTPSPTSSLTS